MIYLVQVCRYLIYVELMIRNGISVIADVIEDTLKNRLDLHLFLLFAVQFNKLFHKVRDKHTMHALSVKIISVVFAKKGSEKFAYLPVTNLV